MKYIPLLAVLLIASAGVAANTPAGWKVLIDRTKTCQIAAPQDWTPIMFSPSSANSPDNKASFVMHATTGQSLDEVKSVMEGMFPPTKVIEDSKIRLWYVYASSGAAGGAETNWYVGIPSKGNVCGAQITFKDPGMEPLMKQIAGTMAPNN